MSKLKGSLLTPEAEFTLQSYESLKLDPQKLIPYIFSKNLAFKFITQFDKFFFLSKKRKASNLSKIKQEFSQKTINELLTLFNDQKFTNSFLRKVLKKKILDYENVGYFYREKLWLLVSDANYAMHNNKNYYENIKNNFKESLEPFFSLIEMDLARTCDHRFQPEQEMIAKCRNVLQSYAKRNPDIGYCQGLNFIAWELCKRKFSEEEVFWIFSILLENILPMDYYSSMIGVLVDQKIFRDLIEEYLPLIAKKFKELNFDTSLFSIQWFVCVFCKNLKGKLLEVVWDNLLIEGSVALFKVGLTILKILEGEIFKTQDFASLLILIEAKTKELEDELYFQQKINEIYLNKKIIALCRHFYRVNIEEKEFTVMKDSHFSRKFRNLSQIHKKKLKETKKTCNIQSMVCKTLVEYNQTFKNNNYFSFVFRQNPSMLIVIHEYFVENSGEKKQTWNEILQNYNNLEEFQRNLLLIGRHHHICKETVENSPFSPFSPFTPVDFSKIHNFNDTINEFNQQEKNQSFLKGYLKKSVLESRRSIQSSMLEEKQSFNLNEKANENKKKSAEEERLLSTLQKNKRLMHCKTIDIHENDEFNHNNEKNDKDLYIIEKKSNICLGRSYDNLEIEAKLNSSLTIPPLEKLNFKKKVPKSIKVNNLFKKNQTEWDVIMDKTPNNKANNEENNVKIEPRTSLFLLHAKGVYNHINNETIDKYMNVIEKSECINFAHEFFIERSQV